MLRRADGKLLWEAGVTAKEKDPTHGTNPYCSASPVTDGERVIASFASEGLYCYDLQGKELWRRDDLGKQIHIWGNGSSPVIHGDLCYLNFGPARRPTSSRSTRRPARRFGKKTRKPAMGKHRQAAIVRKAEPTYIGSWSIAGLHESRWQRPTAHELAKPACGLRSGDWRGDLALTRIKPLVYTDPIYEKDIVVSMGGFNGKAIAVRAGGKGDMTESRKVWHHPKSPQRIGTGVTHEGHIYIQNDPGIAQCISVTTGADVWAERLNGKAKTGQNWSSVMLSGDKCYTINQGGDCFVFAAKPNFELISVNPLGEPKQLLDRPIKRRAFHPHAPGALVYCGTCKVTDTRGDWEG